MPRVRNPIYDDPDRTDSVAIVVTNSIGAPINIALSSTWPPAAAMTGGLLAGRTIIRLCRPRGRSHTTRLVEVTKKLRKVTLLKPL